MTPSELTPLQHELLERIDVLLPTFAERAPEYDRAG